MSLPKDSKTWRIVKRKIEGSMKNTKCYLHPNNGRITIENVTLNCCENGKHCRTACAEDMIKIIKQLCKKIDNVENRNKRSRNNMENKMENKIENKRLKKIVVENNNKRNNQGPTFIFNAPVTFVQNNTAINIPPEDILRIVRQTISQKTSRDTMYNNIYQMIKNAPDSELKSKIIKMASSNNPQDIVNARIEVHNILVNSLDKVNPKNAFAIDELIKQDEKMVEEECKKHGMILE